MDTPFKSANSWFVEPGKSNRSCQEGTSRRQTLTQDVLLGIATLQSNAPTVEPSDWRGQETPPHMISSNSCARKTKTLTEPSRVVEDIPQEQEHREESSQRFSTQNIARSCQLEEGSPLDGGDDGESSDSHGSRRSRRRGRRSHTPRPRRHQSSTPRPQRPRHGRDDDDRGGGGVVATTAATAHHGGAILQVHIRAPLLHAVEDQEDVKTRT